MIALDTNVLVCAHRGRLNRMQNADVRGNLVFDAQIVALCQEHGISNVLTNDRDFERFNGIVVQYL